MFCSGIRLDDIAGCQEGVLGHSKTGCHKIRRGGGRGYGSPQSSILCYKNIVLAVCIGN